MLLRKKAWYRNLLMFFNGYAIFISMYLNASVIIVYIFTYDTLNFFGQILTII